MKKGLLFLICTMFMTIMLCSFGFEKALANETQGKENGFLLDEDSFAEVYENSEGFQGIKSDVISLYNLVRNAYDLSDKENLSSFSIDNEKIDTLYTTIIGKVENYDRSNDDIATMLKVNINISSIKMSVAGINLLNVASGGNGKNPEAFKDLERALGDVYQDFTQIEDYGQQYVENTEDITAIENEEETEDLITLYEFTVDASELNGESKAVEETGSWVIDEYVDDFGDGIGIKYAKSITEGTFSNSATNDSSLTVITFFDPETKEFSFRLFEYDKSKAAYYNSDFNRILFKFDNEIEEHFLQGSSSNGDLCLSVEKEKEEALAYEDALNSNFASGKDYSDVSLDLALMALSVVTAPETYSGYYQLYKNLANNNDARCVIYLGSSKYSFTIPADGFSEVISIFHEDKYQEAERYLAQKNFDKAKEVFESLDDYKDSKDRVLEVDYKMAQALYDADEYERAKKLFESLGDYSDASNMADSCVEKINEGKYEEAEQYLKDKQFDEAIAAFKDLKGYKDSPEKVLESKYQKALSEIENEHYKAARKIFAGLGDYLDASDQVDKCDLLIKEEENNKKYEQAEEALKNLDYDEAIQLFSELGDYKDSMDRIIQVSYDKAQSLLEHKKYQDAYDLFLSLDDYSDASNKAQECLEKQYKKGLKDLENREYDDAYDIFISLGEYEDAPEKAQECLAKPFEDKYQDALDKLENGKFNEAYELFTSLGDYSNASEKAQECKEKQEEFIEEARKKEYNDAIALKESGEYQRAIKLFTDILPYKDSETQIELCKVLPYAKADVGSILVYGNFNDTDLVWRVIHREGNSVLLIADECIGERHFQKNQNDPKYYIDSPIRNYLQKEFLSVAFTEEQQSLIETRELPTTGGNVSDKIFLLSDQEAQQYFSSDDERIFSDKETWFLRTANPVFSRVLNYSRVIAMLVSSKGEVYQNENSTDYARGIRPAMWLDVSSYIHEVESKDPSFSESILEQNDENTSETGLVYGDLETIKNVQDALNDAGFDCGVPDGISGEKTKSAIKAFRERKGLPVTDEIDSELLAELGLYTELESPELESQKSESSELESTDYDTKIPGTSYYSFESIVTSKPDETMVFAENMGYRENLGNLILSIYAYNSLEEIKRPYQEYSSYIEGFDFTAFEVSSDRAIEGKAYFSSSKDTQEITLYYFSGASNKTLPAEWVNDDMYYIILEIYA